MRAGIIHAAVLLLPCAAPAAGAAGTHFVVGRNPPPSGPNAKLWSSGSLAGVSGHGTPIDPTEILPIPTQVFSIDTTNGPNGWKSNVNGEPRRGGYSFMTVGFDGLGLDYTSSSGHELFVSELPSGGTTFLVSLKRLAYDRPYDFGVYSEGNTPRLLEDGDEYAFGDQTGGHTHPFFSARRPGQYLWTMQYTSDQWLPSDEYQYTFTTVPGRGAVVSFDISGLFNADVIDSDGSDAPVSFDGSGNSLVLNGNYGTSLGIPINGQLGDFQVGGPGGARLAGSLTNALFDNGALSTAASYDLVSRGLADSYITIEFLLGGAGTFGVSTTGPDKIECHFIYADGKDQRVLLIKAPSSWDRWKGLDDWQQAASPRPHLAIGRSGDRSAGFARSNGSGIDNAAGDNFFLFRSCVSVDSSRTLNQITIGDFGGTARVGIFAMLGVRRAPLEILTPALPAATVGQPYSVMLTAAGTPPYQNWSAMGLPMGLMIDADTGVISGTPGAGAQAGSPYSVTIEVEDSIHDYNAAFPVETDTVVLSLTANGVAPTTGDIDGDGDVDGADLILFSGVLLKTELNPTYVSRSDINASGQADGDDIPLFVDALF